MPWQFCLEVISELVCFRLYFLDLISSETHILLQDALYYFY